MEGVGAVSASVVYYLFGAGAFRLVLRGEGGVILEAGRGFIQGEPTQVATAFALAAALLVVFAAWARTGLRSAERSG